MVRSPVCIANVAHVSEVLANDPIRPRSHRTGARVACNLAAESHVERPRLHAAQASLNIAKALAVTELSEVQCEELVEAGEALHFVIASIALYATYDHG
jgi:hypothetical protein